MNVFDLISHFLQHFIEHFIDNHQYDAMDPPPPASGLTDPLLKQTQLHLQRCVQGCPAQWGPCGFPGCALDVVDVLRLRCEA